MERFPGPPQSSFKPSTRTLKKEGSGKEGEWEGEGGEERRMRNRIRVERGVREGERLAEEGRGVCRGKGKKMDGGEG